MIADPISLEVLRNRLHAIAEDSAATIARTAVSPVITESHDFGVALLDADGNLVSGGGWVSLHWVASSRAIRATIERYAETIAPGDIFLANDPYHGGGLHPNDVVVERPIFANGRRVAWVALSAHMMDMGGMVPGSFAPAATECFQEAIRFPPVRLFRGGLEVTDVWDILRTNVRAAPLVEMDMRGLIAGAHVAEEMVQELVESLGLDFFLDGVRALQDLSERQLRARIEVMADGVYRVNSWNEWEDELYRIPCRLTIDGDQMVFDFEGASPQAPHYFNSQPYIIKSAMMQSFGPIVAPDLPYTEGLLVPIELRCPEGSILHAIPPAPMNNGHVPVAQTAAEAMMACVRMALWATQATLPGSHLVHGWSGGVARTTTMWSGTTVDQGPATWALMEGSWPGSSAGIDRDGLDCSTNLVGRESPPTTADVEVLEWWYPMLIVERSIRVGVNGPGAHRSGGGSHVKIRPHGTESIVGQMLGIREWLPVDGAAGGFPGSTGRFLLQRADGRVERISSKAADVVVRDGETFEVQGASGGGVGDPVTRDLHAVAEDIADGLISHAEAEDVYGVVLRQDGSPDVAASEASRARILNNRLVRAKPPTRRLSDSDIAGLEGVELPLYPGIVHRGGVSYVETSGTPLSITPHPWTDGCAVLEQPVPGPGPDMVVRAYLDPRSGTSLYVEAVPADEPCSFEVSPCHWTEL